MVIVNGVSLNNSALGWALIEGSSPYPEMSRELVSARRPGRDGVMAGVPAVFSSAVMTLVVDTPMRNLSALSMLFASGGVLKRDGFVAEFELASMSVEDEPGFAQATFVLRLPSPFWRSASVSTFTKHVDSTSDEMLVFPAVSGSDPWDGGMSAPIQDGIVRVKGAATGIQLTDASGAWLLLPDIDAGDYVRFDMDTGRAYQTTTDTWEGGTEISGAIDFGGPRGMFEITPTFTPGDPGSRKGVLTIATVTRDGAVVEVRARDSRML